MKTVTGLEIGTSKVCAAVVGVENDGAGKVLGMGVAPSQGVRKGRIVDPKRAEAAARKALAQAEDSCDVTISQVYLSLNGGLVGVKRSLGRHTLASRDRVVSKEDVAEAEENAGDVLLPEGHAELHRHRVKVFLDGKAVRGNPVGLSARRVEVECLLVHARKDALLETARVVEEMLLMVEDVIFSGYASAVAVTSRADRARGALVIDLGGGTTKFAVMRAGGLVHAGALAVGGDHVSVDLAAALKFPLALAEEAKRSHGSALVGKDWSRGKVRLRGSMGRGDREADLTFMHRVMNARLEETFQIVRDMIEEGSEFSLGELESVILCGGGARIPRICNLAQRIFGRPARMGKIRCFELTNPQMDQPEFATALGLAAIGVRDFKQRASRDGIWRSIKRHARDMIRLF